MKPDAVKLVVVQRLSPIESIVSISYTSLHAACNPNEIVTGGGFLTAIPAFSDKEPIVYANSRALDPETNEWVVVLKAAPGDEFDARATVDCAHLELGP